MPSHHLQDVSNGAQFLVQSPNSRVLAFGRRGFNITTAATSEPWPLKSCPGLQKSTLLVKQQMPLKRSWLKQDKLISKSGRRNIKASYYQNHCLLLTSSGSSLITQGKLFKGQQGTVFCTARYVHTVLEVGHWSLPQGHTHMTHKSPAKCSLLPLLQHPGSTDLGSY